jgi:uncharacterized protein with NAD-binding domain and iron-sulfur cluster
MTEEVKTVETQSFQIWLSQSLDDLGWTAPHYIGSAFTKPFDTWCDMAYTIPEEAWERPPGTVLYFCGSLAGEANPAVDDDRDYPYRRREAVRRNAVAFLRDTARHLWPQACDARGEFRWDLLANPPGRQGEEAFGESRFDGQYWRANVNPTDRYVLAVPGSAQYRISPLDMTYDNLTIAGDWTSCGLNEGCVEAAVISGRVAAHALAGFPLLEDVVGYDHP